MKLRWLSSGFLPRVVWCKFTDVLEVLTASIIRVMMMEAGALMMAVGTRNIHELLPDYTGQQRRRHFTVRRENLKSRIKSVFYHERFLC
jgi:hypothetical protein